MDSFWFDWLQSNLAKLGRNGTLQLNKNLAVSIYEGKLGFIWVSGKAYHLPTLKEVTNLQPQPPVINVLVELFEIFRDTEYEHTYVELFKLIAKQVVDRSDSQFLFKEVS